MKKLYFLLILSSAVVLACTSASKSFQQGEYKEAMERAIKELQKNPDDKEAAAVLRQAYRFAVERHEERIRNLSASRNEEKFAAIYNEYAQLQNFYELIQQSPIALRLVTPVNYSGYLDTYAEKAAEVHIANAERWTAQDTKRAYREAYNEYKKALRYKPLDVLLKQKRDEAYEAALTKVLVLPMQGYDNYRYHGNYGFMQFQDELLRNLRFQMGSEFVKFYSEWDLRQHDVEPDQVLEFHLSRMIIGRPYETQSVREVSKQVVVKETVYKPDSVVKEYATVRARIITTQSSLVSEADLYLSLRDRKGRTLWTDRFTGRDRWQGQQVTYTGDERALSDSDRSALSRRQQMPPSEDEIMERLFRQINNDLIYRLRSYFARY